MLSAPRGSGGGGVSSAQGLGPSVHLLYLSPSSLGLLCQVEKLTWVPCFGEKPSATGWLALWVGRRSRPSRFLESQNEPVAFLELRTRSGPGKL